jgi:6-phospho-beta-glucosidase
MLDGADFVVTQIRVGGMAARYLDESIPLKYGIVGQETTGPGGMFKALRTIPAMIDIARAVARRAPSALILNYTNPSGIITEAVLTHTSAKLIGLCSGLPGLSAWLITELAADYPRLKLRAVGLNHFGFFHRLEHDGADVTMAGIGRLREIHQAAPKPDERHLAWLDLAQTLGAIPIPGYSEYFYRRAFRLAEAKARPRTRAEEIMEIEGTLFKEAADPAPVAKPTALAKRGGGGYSEVTLAVIKSMLHDRGAEIVASTLNGGATCDLPREAAMESTCRIDRSGAHPLPVGTLPPAFRGTAQALKVYETLVVEAAVKRDRRLAIQALLNHPMAGDLDVVRPLVDEMLAAHGLDYR